jgi:hypothetical protein
LFTQMRKSPTIQCLSSKRGSHSKFIRNLSILNTCRWKCQQGTQGRTQPHKQILVTLCYMYITNKMIVLMKLFLLLINLKIWKLFGLSWWGVLCPYPTLILCNLGKKH